MTSDPRPPEPGITAAIRPDPRDGALDIPLRGRRLALAWSVWGALVVLVVCLFVVATPASYRLLSNPPAAMRTTLALAGIPIGSYALYLTALNIGFAVCYCAVAAVIVWRKPRDPMALFVALFLIVTSTAGPPTAGMLEAAHPAWRLLAEFGVLLSLSCLLLFFFLFPDGRFVPRWMRVPALLFIASLAVAVGAGESLAQPDSWVGLVIPVGLIAGAGTQIYRYRRVSTPLQRQQTKWVVFGGAAALLVVLVNVFDIPILPSFAPPELQATPYDLTSVTSLTFGFLLIPLAIGIAVLRYRLFDIDIIIRRTLVYGVLTTALVLVYLGSVVVLQALFHTLTGEDSQVAIVASTLAIAALFTPLRRHIQAAIDKRFYRRKYDAAKTLTAFSAQLRDEVDLNALTGELLAVIEETIQPAHVSLWLREAPHRSSKDPKITRA
jgi:hypothetical protein